MDFSVILSQIAGLWTMETMLGGMTAGSLALGALVMIACVVLRGVFARIVIAKLLQLTSKTSTEWDDRILKAIEGPLKTLPLTLGVFFFAQYFAIPPEIVLILNKIGMTMVVASIFWALFNVLTPLSILLEGALATITAKSETLYAEEFTGIIIKGLKIAIIGIGIIIILSQWGVNVVPVLGGLGIAGMAAAFAAQDTISNIFGGIKILIDGVYRRGEWIEIDGLHGTVEDIGIATTKLRAFDKGLIAVPNQKMANSVVKNWSRMTNRRIKMTIGVEYRTTAQQLENIVNKIRDYLISSPVIANPRDFPVSQMVHLTEFADSSININIYCFTVTTNWAEWRDIQHNFMLELKRIVEGEGTAFAFPTQSIHLESTPSEEKDIVTEDDDVDAYKRRTDDKALERQGDEDAIADEG